MTFGRHLRLLPVASGANLKMRGLELSVLTPDPDGRGTGGQLQSPMASDLISCAYAIKPPQNPKRTEFRKLPGW